jgi:hypothetical protein
MEQVLMKAEPLTASARLRADLRDKILSRMADRKMTRTQAGKTIGFTAAQMSLLYRGDDVFSADRLADAAQTLDLRLTLRASRPYVRK